MQSETTGWRAWLSAFRPQRIEPDAVSRIRGWVQAAIGDIPGVSISVNEIACRDPACPGVETIILVMAPGQRTRACKISKTLEDVTEVDVRETVAAG
jgi:hypothetical protein